MTQENTPLTVAPKKTNNVFKRSSLLLVIIGIIAIIVLFGSAYRTLVNHAAELEQTRKDILDQKDQISGLSAQINSLNDKVKEYKQQEDALAASFAQESETIAALKKNFDVFETKVSDLNQEFDDKFGRLSKEIGDAKALVGPVKEDIVAIKDDSKKWQKEYVASLSDLQVHVTRAAGLVAQMRDEVNKKIEYISMVQEKMIKDAAAAANAPIVLKSTLPAEDEKVVHRQVLNSDMAEPQDKLDLPLTNPK